MNVLIENIALMAIMFVSFIWGFLFGYHIRDDEFKPQREEGQHPGGERYE